VTRLKQLALAAAATLVAAAPGTPTDAKRPVELGDYYRVETVTSPAISPDGGRVAFVRNRIVESENRRLSEIWLAPSDGSAPAVRLTSPSFSASEPRFSPDGKLLAFSSRRPLPGAASQADEATVWFLRLDGPGGEAFQIEGVRSTPHFSPDNKWIAFTRAAKRPTGEAPARSDLERRIDERFKGRIYDWLSYRGDGRGYLPDPRDPLASPPEELFVVAREGGPARQLTQLGVDVGSVAWRPDSRALVVSADTHQRDEWSYERADLWLVPLEGETRRLTDDGHHHSDSAFSADGGSLVFTRQLGLSQVIQAKQDKGAPVDLYRMDLGSGALRNLTADWDLVPGAPVWCADGSVLVEAETGGEAQLFRVSAAGGRVEPVTNGHRRLGGVSVSRDGGRIAYSAQDATHPADVFSANADGSDERRLSAVSDAWLREVELQPAERLSYTSKDGTRVEGWILLPASYREQSSPVPLVLQIHGGPHAAYGAAFSFPFQLLAARGYAVLYTNPRGSTGYGEAFQWATWGGGWGLKDAEDVLAGVDAALAKYRIDPQRLGVGGYSYGGFLTNWIIGHTTRFAAAVSGAGISNWVSDYGTADIPRTKESEFYGPPWEARSQALLIRQSPVHYAGAVVTPTLFLHGEADWRVPIEQGEQMYVALKKRRIPARFVRYPDTGHGDWTPWNTVHRYHQELRWWDERLGAALQRPRR